jgi:hypothetical protein
MTFKRKLGRQLTLIRRRIGGQGGRLTFGTGGLHIHDCTITRTLVVPKGRDVRLFRCRLKGHIVARMPSHVRLSESAFLPSSADRVNTFGVKPNHG